MGSDILAIDDSAETLKLLVSILSEAGHRVRPATSGELALRSIAARRPDLILLDVRMPGMDGFELCRHLKSTEGTWDIPVLFLSAADEAADKVRGFELGGHDYIPKPFQAEELLARVRTHLRLRELSERQEELVLARTLQLTEANARLESILKTAMDGFLRLDKDGRILEVNDSYCRMSGYREDELVGMPSARLVAEEAPEETAAHFARIREAGADRFESVHRRKDGGHFDVEISIQVSGKDGDVVSFVRDITERKRGERFLRETAFFFKESQRVGAIGSFKTDFASDSWESSEVLDGMLGIGPGYARNNQGWLDLVHPDDREMMARHLAEVLGKRIPFDKEYRIKRQADGQTRWVHARGAVERDASGAARSMIGILQDIEERKLSEQRIQASLVEKETLLREIYHRTKNNMGVISALLGLQADRFDDARLKQAFSETQDRIRSMALVHQKLYEGRDLSRVNLRDYISDLVPAMLESHGVLADSVAFVPDMEDVSVLIDTAIPCGLILNEFISNALKHAFPGGRRGSLSIRLSRGDSGRIRLVVGDDGIGLPPGFDPRRDGHMGMQNIFGLAEAQLEARVEYRSSEGLSWSLEFDDDRYQPRV